MKPRARIELHVADRHGSRWLSGTILAITDTHGPRYDVMLDDGRRFVNVHAVSVRADVTPYVIDYAGEAR
jgi:hypothetical protein